MAIKVNETFDSILCVACHYIEDLYPAPTRFELLFHIAKHHMHSRKIRVTRVRNSELSNLFLMNVNCHGYSILWVLTFSSQARLIHSKCRCLDWCIKPDQYDDHTWPVHEERRIHEEAALYHMQELSSLVFLPPETPSTRHRWSISSSDSVTIQDQCDFEFGILGKTYLYECLRMEVLKCVCDI